MSSKFFLDYLQRIMNVVSLSSAASLTHKEKKTCRICVEISLSYLGLMLSHYHPLYLTGGMCRKWAIRKLDTDIPSGIDLLYSEFSISSRIIHVTNTDFREELFSLHNMLMFFVLFYICSFCRFFLLFVIKRKYCNHDIIYENM